MKVSISKSKNTTIYYLSKSVWINGRSTTKTVEKIGTEEEVRKLAGGGDPLSWAKEYARKRTLEEKEAGKELVVRYSPAKLIDKDEQRTVNIGYLFLKDIYHSLGLHKICNDIKSRHKYDFDLSDILSMLTYTRILYPGSKRSSLKQAARFLEEPECDLHQVYRALCILSEESDFIQSELFRNSEALLKRKKGILYYDCTNYYFETEEEAGIRRYGVSKEHRPNPIVQMGLFMDSDGIPLSFSIFPGNESEQPSMTPLEEKLIKDYGIKRLIVCTDAGLSSSANRRFNNVKDRRFITTQSIKKLKGFLKDFCLSPEGWHLPGDSSTYDLTTVDKESFYDHTFYKDRWINEDGIEQHLIVTFSFKYRDYQKSVRDRQVGRAQKAVSQGSQKRPTPNSPSRFISVEHCTKDGEIAENSVLSIDSQRILEEERFDGFYAICTNLDDDISSILEVSRHRWKIEECFRIMKSEFRARPVYVSRDDRIKAHFLTCFIALIVYRLLERKLSNAYTCDEIISSLRHMDMLKIKGEGFIPAYERNDLTDMLHDAFGFRTDYQVISNRDMKKICTKTKNNAI